MSDEKIVEAREKTYRFIRTYAKGTYPRDCDAALAEHDDKLNREASRGWAVHTHWMGGNAVLTTLLVRRGERQGE